MTSDIGAKYGGMKRAAVPSCCGSPVLPSSRESLRGDTRTETPLELTPNKALDFLGHAIILFMWGRIILSAVIVVLVVVWLLAIWLVIMDPGSLLQKWLSGLW